LPLKSKIIFKVKGFLYFCQKMSSQKTRMKSKFGNKIRLLREEQNLLLRQVASLLDMDTAQLSKIERGERQAKKDTVLNISKILKINKDELLTLWLADQIYDVVKNEENALKAMIVAEEQVEYLKANKKNDN
jgi:HTH-type transcriptional regulator, competence development regulator